MLYKEWKIHSVPWQYEQYEHKSCTSWVILEILETSSCLVGFRKHQQYLFTKHLTWWWISGSRIHPRHAVENRALESKDPCVEVVCPVLPWWSQTTIKNNYTQSEFFCDHEFHWMKMCFLVEDVFLWEFLWWVYSATEFYPRESKAEWLPLAVFSNDWQMKCHNFGFN